MWIAVIILVAFIVISVFITGINIKSRTTEKKIKKREKVLSVTLDNIPKPTIIVEEGDRSRNIKRTSKGEELCRKVLEDLFPEHKFSSCRPDFLKSTETDCNLELDCYNEDLGLAVEYNGRQHYEYTPKFHKTIDNFKSQQWNDEYKAKLCKLNNINLIVVSYKITHKRIPSYISDELAKLGYVV